MEELKQYIIRLMKDQSEISKTHLLKSYLKIPDNRNGLFYFNFKLETVGIEIDLDDMLWLHEGFEYEDHTTYIFYNMKTKQIDFGTNKHRSRFVVPKLHENLRVYKLFDQNDNRISYMEYMLGKDE